MQLNKLSDKELLGQTKDLVHEERAILMEILRHFREVERRKLFSELGYSSLFDYCVKELGYSEGQACRRIKAMRLANELPEIEDKIADGSLSLSNISQAQTMFREVKIASERSMPKEEKLAVLERLENKSVREAQMEIMKIRPEGQLPHERTQHLTEDHTEMTFVADAELREQLEAVKALLGPKAVNMSLAELVKEMASLSRVALEEKKFGKRRVAKESAGAEALPPTSRVEPTSETSSQSSSRHIPKSVKHRVWRRDRGACQDCGARYNLNFDHIVPFSKGGTSDAHNLRLLCFHCNQRAAIREFGMAKMARSREVMELRSS